MKQKCTSITFIYHPWKYDRTFDDRSSTELFSRLDSRQFLDARIEAQRGTSSRVSLGGFSLAHTQRGRSSRCDSPVRLLFSWKENRSLRRVCALQVGLLRTITRSIHDHEIDQRSVVALSKSTDETDPCSRLWSRCARQSFRCHSRTRRRCRIVLLRALQSNHPHFTSFTRNRFVLFVQGAIEGPMEFAEGVATGVRTLFGSAVGGAAGAFSKITGVLGKGLATLTFDEDYKVSRIRRKEPANNAAADIAVGGKNVVMVRRETILISELRIFLQGFVDGVTGVVTKPVSGAKHGGASGFVKGLGKGFLGLVTRPTGGIVDFASTSLDLIKRYEPDECDQLHSIVIHPFRTAQQEEIVRRVRYPRHVGRDGLVRPYISHEAMGFYILNVNHVSFPSVSKNDFSFRRDWTMVNTANQTPMSRISLVLKVHRRGSCPRPSKERSRAIRRRSLFSSRRLLFVTEISFLGLYEIDWQIEYEDLKEEPVVKPNLGQIQILTKVRKRTTRCAVREGPSFSLGASTNRNVEVQSFVRQNDQISKYFWSPSKSNALNLSFWVNCCFSF